MKTAGVQWTRDPVTGETWATTPSGLDVANAEADGCIDHGHAEVRGALRANAERLKRIRAHGCTEPGDPEFLFQAQPGFICGPKWMSAVDVEEEAHRARAVVEEEAITRDQDVIRRGKTPNLLVHVAPVQQPEENHAVSAVKALRSFAWHASASAAVYVDNNLLYLVHLLLLTLWRLLVIAMVALLLTFEGSLVLALALLPFFDRLFPHNVPKVAEGELRALRHWFRGSPPRALRPSEY